MTLKSVSFEEVAAGILSSLLFATLLTVVSWVVYWPLPGMEVALVLLASVWMMVDSLSVAAIIRVPITALSAGAGALLAYEYWLGNSASERLLGAVLGALWTVGLVLRSIYHRRLPVTLIDVWPFGAFRNRGERIRSDTFLTVLAYLFVGLLVVLLLWEIASLFYALYIARLITPPP